MEVEMKYIIEKDELYLKQESDITIQLGDILSIKKLPIQNLSKIEGRLIEVQKNYITLDASDQYDSNIVTINFIDIFSMEVTS
jgi:ribosome maturation factor RimP